MTDNPYSDIAPVYWPLIAIAKMRHTATAFSAALLMLEVIEPGEPCIRLKGWNV